MGPWVNNENAKALAKEGSSPPFLCPEPGIGALLTGGPNYLVESPMPSALTGHPCQGHNARNARYIFTLSGSTSDDLVSFVMLCITARVFSFIYWSQRRSVLP